MAKAASKTAPVSRKRMTADGWVNVATGLGVLGRDKTVGGYFLADRLTYEQCEELWRGNDIGARIVEVPPAEMLREGFGIKIGTGEDEANKKTEKSIISECDDLEVTDRFNEAMNYDRAYGGAAIFIGAQDGQPDLRLPLNINNISRIHFLTVLEPRELKAIRYYNNGLKRKFGQPEIFRITPYTMTGRESAAALSNAEIHESRFITFPGIVVSRRQRRELQGWGDSVFVRAIRALELFDQSWGGAGVLLADFAQAVLKIKGLAEFLAANDDTAIINRARTMATARSVANMMIMDADEEFTRVATPITGMPDTLDKFSLRLAAAADMPVSLLLGQSPAGLNATGDSDIRFFYDRIQSKRRRYLKPRLERLLKLIMLCKGSVVGGREPDAWQVTFPPLWQETESQQAETHLKQAQADLVYLEHSVTSPDEIAKSRFGGDKYSIDTSLDKGTRDLLIKSTLDPVGEEVPIEETTSPAGAPVSATTPPNGKQPIELTPTDVATIFTVNEYREQKGWGPKKLPDGSPDPDGNLTIAAYQAKNKAVIAAAANATEGNPVTPAPGAASAPTP